MFSTLQDEIMKTVIVQSKTPLENIQDETILAEVSLVPFMADMTANPDPDFSQALQKRESLIITLKKEMKQRGFQFNTMTGFCTLGRA